MDNRFGRFTRSARDRDAVGKLKVGDKIQVQKGVKRGLEFGGAIGVLLTADDDFPVVRIGSNNFCMSIDELEKVEVSDGATE